SGPGRAADGRARPGARPAPGPGAPWQRTKTWRGPRTVRAKVVALLMVPIISLMALWGLAAVSTAQNMWSLQQLRTVNTDVRQPIDAAISAIQQERSAAMRLLSISGNGTGLAQDQSGYQADFGATDGAQALIQTDSQRAAAALDNLGADTQKRIDTLLARLGSLGTLRREVASGGISVDTAYSDYCAAIDDGFAVEGSLATLQDDAVGSNAQSVLQLAQAGEMLARQDAVLNAAFSAGQVTPADYQEFTGAAYSQNLLQIDAARALRPVDQQAYQQVVSSSEYLQLRQDQTDVEDYGTGPTSGIGFTPADWVKPESVTLTGLDAVASAAGTAAVARIDPYAGFLTTPQGIAVLVGLVAVLLSLLVSVRIGRGLVLELVSLRDTALDLAQRRLPRAIARLRAGQSVDVDVEAPPPVHVEDEIGQVSEALAAAARAAIQAAVERAEVVSAVAGVFLNLARRSQLLVHRQLALLDTMERRNEDPDELEDLFRLDHLATRMRRHAEGLIILSGATPGRGWRKPVPLMDVLRAAVAEVEDYARVDVRRLELVHLAGTAVADLTHLIAELVENATVFSPPHTRVQVRGEQVGSGFAIDIEDRGLGMGEQAIAEANQRIANADQADLFDSDRLGLFVVSRLARRHSIQVTLGRSAYGGTTAVVLLPKALLENTAAGTFSQAEEGHTVFGGQAPEAGRAQFAGAKAGAGGAGSATSAVSGADGRYRGGGGQDDGPGPAVRVGAGNEARAGSEAGAGTTGAGNAGGSGSSAGSGGAARANGEPILIGAPGGSAGAPAGSGGAAAAGVGAAEPKANGVHHLNGYYRHLSDLEPDRPPVPAQSLPTFEPSGPDSADPEAGQGDPGAGSDPARGSASGSAASSTSGSAPASPVNSASDPGGRQPAADRRWQEGFGNQPPATESGSAQPAQPTNTTDPAHPAQPPRTEQSAGSQAIRDPFVEPIRTPPATPPGESQPGRSGSPGRGPSTGPSAPVPPGPSPAAGPDELPRRIRQANLAPQLRQEPPGPGEAADYVPPDSNVPATPERARATMAAFQKGWTLGRTERPADPPSGHGDGAGNGTAAGPGQVAAPHDAP
ncbi:MAG TPA: nitrate- and nitrite sensing domain-containing protein, partial [Actinocrinis sp.]|nr:nitrate- and nitrite sensing domain-containing protein [Actinocrinis sp.]